MSSTAIILLIISAISHAGWNLISKSQHPSAAFFFIANTVGILAFSPFLLIHLEQVVQFSLQVWILVIIAGFFLALNYCALSGAYQSGDMSVAYPLARSTPVVIVTGITLMAGQSSQIGVLCLLGIPLVVSGCFLIPMKRFSDFSLINYLNKTCFFAFLAALGTAGYSMADDLALRLLRGALGTEMNTVSISLTYACLEASSCFLWLVLFIGFNRKERQALRYVLNTSKKIAFLTGAGIFGTYGLVLISMAYVTNVSYVVAFRQLSIPIGTCFGIMILKEMPNKPKIVGVLIMFFGLILVSIG